MTTCGTFLLENPPGMSVPEQRQSGSLHWERLQSGASPDNDNFVRQAKSVKTNKDFISLWGFLNY